MFRTQEEDGVDLRHVDAFVGQIDAEHHVYFPVPQISQRRFAIIGRRISRHGKRLDDQRLSDLRRISSAVDLYRTRAGALAASLDDVRTQAAWRVPPRDPETDQAYEYRVLMESRYELCATFNRASDEERPLWNTNVFWAHTSGRQCFPVGDWCEEVGVQGAQQAAGGAALKFDPGSESGTRTFNQRTCCGRRRIPNPFRCREIRNPRGRAGSALSCPHIRGVKQKPLKRRHSHHPAVLSTTGTTHALAMHRPLEIAHSRRLN